MGARQSYLVFTLFKGAKDSYQFHVAAVSCANHFGLQSFGQTDRHDNQAGRGRRFPSSSRDWGHEVEW